MKLWLSLLFIIFSVFSFSENKVINTSQTDPNSNISKLASYNKAIDYLSKSQPDLALPILFKLLSKTPKTHLRDSIQISIAEGYREKREYKKGIKILYSILQSDSINSRNKAYTNNRLAAIYNEMISLGQTRLDSVIKYSKNCLILSEKYNFEDLSASSQNELGYVYKQLNKPSIALQFYKASYQYYINQKSYIYAANVAINLSNSYLQLRNYPNAILIIDSIINNINETDYRNMFMRLYLQKSSVYEKWGKIDSAFKYMNRGRIAQKHFFLDRMDQQIFEMSAKYELNQKEHKIKEEQIKAQSKERENVYLLILIAGLISLILIGLFLVKFWYKNNKNKRQLALAQQEILKAELKYKNKELSTAIAHSVAYNDVLESVKKALSSTDKKNAINIINANIDTERSWHNFLLNFNQLYPNFFSELNQKHPSLTENEIKLSGLLMMELKSKEIAAVFNIALSSVNKNRQRLRKKLDLKPEENIASYFSNLCKK